jgi:hypothetical protein
MKKVSPAKAQRRKGAKKTLRNAVALCAFAPLRERSLVVQNSVVNARSGLR